MSGLIIQLRNRIVSVAACHSANSRGSNKHGEVIKSAGGGVEPAVAGWPAFRDNYLLSEPERQTVMSMM